MQTVHSSERVQSRVVVSSSRNRCSQPTSVGICEQPSCIRVPGAGFGCPHGSRQTFSVRLHSVVWWLPFVVVVHDEVALVETDVFTMAAGGSWRPERTDSATATTAVTTMSRYRRLTSRGYIGLTPSSHSGGDRGFRCV